MSGDDYVSNFDADQLESLTFLFINAHGNGTDIGLVFFGFHLVVIGYLVYKSDYIPNILGLGVILSGLGYLFDS